MDPWHQKSIDALRSAQKSIDEARSWLGNDHPAYPELKALLSKTYEIEQLYG